MFEILFAFLSVLLIFITAGMNQPVGFDASMIMIMIAVFSVFLVLTIVLKKDACRYSAWFFAVSAIAVCIVYLMVKAEMPAACELVGDDECMFKNTEVADTMFCEKAKDAREKYFEGYEVTCNDADYVRCYSRAAANTGNLRLCDEIGCKERCITGAYYLNPDLCQKEDRPQDCILKTAIETHDPDMCLLHEDRKRCYLSVGMGVPVSDTVTIGKSDALMEDICNLTTEKEECLAAFEQD